MAGVLVVCMVILAQQVKKSKNWLIKAPTLVFATHPFRTGDLLLFHSQGDGTFAALTRFMTSCFINHVGMVYVHPATNHPFLLESTFIGVRVAPLFAKLKSAKGKTFVRTLDPPLQPFQQTLIDEFVRVHWNDAYMTNVLVHFSNRYNPLLRLPASKEHQEFTCCTLVASCLVHGKVLQAMSDTELEELNPKDFTSRANKLQWVHGYTYQPEQMLTCPD